MRIVTGGDDGRAYLWCLSTGKLLRKFGRMWGPGHRKRVNAVAVPPGQSTVVSASDDKTVRVWGVHDGQCIATLKGHEGGLRCLGYSENGEILAYGDDQGLVYICNLSDMELKHTIPISGGGCITGLAFHDENLVICSNRSPITVCNWMSGECRLRFSCHASYVHSIAIFPGGQRLLTGAQDNTVRVWNLISGECEHVSRMHTGWVRSVVMSYDGRTVVSGSDDGSIMIWALISEGAQR